MERRKGVTRESGQAIIEYMPIVAGYFALTVFVVWAFGGALADIFSDMVQSVVNASDVAQGPADDDTEGQAPIDEGPCVQWSPGPGGSPCNQSDYCELREYEGQTFGTIIAASSDSLEQVVFKTGQDMFVVAGQGQYLDDCLQVDVAGSAVSWMIVGSGPKCQDVSHVQLWQKPFCQ